MAQLKQLTSLLGLLAVLANCSAADPNDVPALLDVVDGLDVPQVILAGATGVSSAQYAVPRPLRRQRGNDQSVTIGGVYSYDRQLLTRSVFQSATLFRVHTETVNWSDHRVLIHCIQIVDLQRNGHNAAASVQDGGIGHHEVSIRFKSQRSGNINYLVVLWGQ